MGGSAWLRKPSRKGGNWHCYWQPGAGRSGRSTRQSQNVGPDETYARWFKSQKELEMRGHAMGLPKKAAQTPLSAAAVDYLENYSKKEKSARTYRNFDKPAVDELAAFFPDRRLCDLTAKDGVKWKHHLDSAHKGSTPRMRWDASVTFLNYLVGVGDLAANPWKGNGGPRDGDGGGRALTEAEDLVLMAACPPELRRSADFATGAGPRIGEVTTFDWTWVTDERHHGESVWFGNIPWRLRKTGSMVGAENQKDCVFPIVGRAREAMGPRQQGGLVFPYSVWTLQHQLVDIRDRAGLPDVTFHWTRHTFATNFFKAGGRSETLLETRLWTDPRSLRRYIHVDHEAMVDDYLRASGSPPVPPKAKGPGSFEPGP